jgi:hypothetical protein
MHAFTSNSKHSINFNRMLEERQILLSLQEMDPEVQKVKLAEEQACSLHSFSGQDLSTEMEDICTRVAGVEDECTIEIGKLSMLVAGIPNARVDLKMLPIWDIPQLPMMAQEVLEVAGLILEHLREEDASGASPWD